MGRVLGHWESMDMVEQYKDCVTTTLEVMLPVILN